MNRYLLFDSGCYSCRSLATHIEEVVDGKLKAVALESEEAKQLLRRVFPNGWKHQPYLITVKKGSVATSFGSKLMLDLSLLLGPKKGLEVFRVAQRYGVGEPLGSQHFSSPRRGFLKRIGTTAGLLLFGHASLSSKTLSAQSNEQKSWQIITSVEGSEFVSLTLDSSEYKKFVDSLSQKRDSNLVIQSSEAQVAEGILPDGQSVVLVTVPLSGGTGDSHYSMLFDKTTQGMIMSAGILVTTDRMGNTVGWIERNGTDTIDVVISPSGEIVKAKQTDNQGNSTNIDTTSFSLSQSDGTDSIASAPVQDGWCCIRNCMASQGIADALILIAGTICAVGCLTPPVGAALCAACIIVAIGVPFTGVVGECVDQCIVRKIPWGGCVG